MRRTILGAGLAVLIVTGGLLPLTAAAAGDGGTYQNPVLNADFPDPFVLRVGSTYYAYGTNQGENVQGLVSTDLATWRRTGDALPRLPGWAASGRTWSPAVLQRGDQFVLYYTVHDRRSGLQCLSRATSGSPSRT